MTDYASDYEDTMNITGLFKLCLLRSFPLMLAYFLLNICNFLVMILMAGISLAALAAGAIISTTIGTMSVIILSVALPVAISGGYYFGKGEPNKMGTLWRQSLIMVTAIGVVFTLLMFYCKPILKTLHQPPAVIVALADYFHMAAYGFLPFCWVFVVGQLFIGIGDMKRYFIFSFANSILMLSLVYILSQGFGPIAPMGMRGVGLAFSLASIIMLISQVIFVANAKTYKSFYLLRWLFDLPWKPSLSMAGQIAVQRGNEFVALMVFTYLIGHWLATSALGAQQILLQLVLLASLIPFAISQAIGPMVAQYVGQQSSRQAYQMSWVAVLTGGILVTILALIFKFNTHAIINWFAYKHEANDKVIALATEIFSIMLIYLIADTVRIIFIGVLRGFNQVKNTMLVSLFSFWIISMPAVYLVHRIYPNNLYALNLAFLSGVILNVILNIAILKKCKA